MKKMLLVLLGLMLWEQQCYANPTYPNPFVAVPSLLIEAVIISVCVMPFRLDWFRFLYCWPLVTFITWLVSVFPIMSFYVFREINKSQNVSSNDLLIKTIIFESVIVLIEALILNAMSKKKYFQLSGSKSLGWVRSISISFIANAASYFAGMYFAKDMIQP